MYFLAPRYHTAPATRGGTSLGPAGQPGGLRRNSLIGKTLSKTTLITLVVVRVIKIPNLHTPWSHFLDDDGQRSLARVTHLLVSHRVHAG